MASHHGLLPPSKEVVLEIQLNKLINDFLFSGPQNRNSTGFGDVQEEDASRSMVSNKTDQHCSVQNSPWKMVNPSCISSENGNITENVDNPAHSTSVTDMTSVIPSVTDAHCPDNASSKMSKGSKGVQSTQITIGSIPISEDVRLDIPERKPSSCNEGKPQHTNKLKVFRLSRAHSTAGSLFCFSMERRQQHGERKDEDRHTKSERSGIKLTRIGSLPCHSTLHGEAEKEVKHTCGKPPRPPRSASAEGPCPLLPRHASAGSIFVLHGTSRRSRLERRKKLATSRSSSASLWALVFTLCFAMVMIGEGFWSQSSALLEVDASMNSTKIRSHLNLNTRPASLKTTATSLEPTTVSNLHVSSQLEKEMQRREFWVSRGLDPS